MHVSNPNKLYLIVNVCLSCCFSVPLAFATIALFWAPSTALAQTQPRTHATDEALNACAQRRPECPPTLTPTPTVTPYPTPTQVPPTQVPPTLEPTVTQTPVPALPNLGVDPGAENGYVRPVPDSSAEGWLELALPQGRWFVSFAADCERPTAWTNVVFAYQDGRPLTLDASTGAMCSIAQWLWESSTPCSSTDDQCDVNADLEYMTLVASQPTETVVVVTDTPTPVPPRPPAPPPAAAPPPQVIYVQAPPPPAQVIVVTAVPEATYTVADVVPIPTPTPTIPPGPTPTTVAPWWITTVTPSPTATVIPTATATDEPVAVVMTVMDSSNSGPNILESIGGGIGWLIGGGIELFAVTVPVVVPIVLLLLTAGFVFAAPVLAAIGVRQAVETIP